MSDAHFIRSFKRAFGETPHRYLQRRRIERAMFLLRRTDIPLIDVTTAVGYRSAGTFGRTFREITGSSPSEYRRARGVEGPEGRIPHCFVSQSARPSSFGEAIPFRPT